MKVSNFKLATSILRRLCYQRGIAFSDVTISFEENMEDNALIIGDTKNVCHTIYKIVSEYANASPAILGRSLFDSDQEKEEFLLTLATKLRTFLYKEDSYYDTIEEPTKQTLYSKPLIWILMKDLICPLYDISPINLDIFLINRSDIDIAAYCDNIENIDGIEKPFIFLNDIDNNIIQNSLLFIAALEAHDLFPAEVIKDIYEGDLYEKFYGLLEIALEDGDINDFECILIDVIGIDLFDLIPAQIDGIRDHKVAQNEGSTSGTPFWFLGLTEKMLEPTRGYDWTTYKGLQPYVKEFWDKVEEIKIKRQKSGKDAEIPFDMLLRLKTKQFDNEETDTNMTLQGLLSSNRVW